MKFWMKGKDKIKILSKMKSLDGKEEWITIQEEIAEFLKNNKSKIIKEDKEEVVIEIIPNETNPLFLKLEMTIDRKNGIVLKGLKDNIFKIDK